MVYLHPHPSQYLAQELEGPLDRAQHGGLAPIPEVPGTEEVRGGSPLRSTSAVSNNKHRQQAGCAAEGCIPAMAAVRPHAHLCGRPMRSADGAGGVGGVGRARGVRALMISATSSADLASGPIVSKVLELLTRRARNA
eukprot:COSAG01_NODE_3245_length_6352_cov_137.561502_6_plen_138_part_00